MKNEQLDKRIVEFIKNHHVLTLATCVDNAPWCSNCFYAYNKESNSFIFTSDDETKHIQHVRENPKVAASIVLETSVVGKIQGLQIQGELIEAKDEVLKNAKKIYLKQFPFAALMKTKLWILQTDYMKMTDNRLGFGKKLIWEINNY